MYVQIKKAPTSKMIVIMTHLGGDCVRGIKWLHLLYP